MSDASPAYGLWLGHAFKAERANKGGGQIPAEADPFAHPNVQADSSC